jgi:hypothetical protein
MGRRRGDAATQKRARKHNEKMKGLKTHTKPNNGSHRRRNLLLTNHSTHAFCARKSKYRRS